MRLKVPGTAAPLGVLASTAGLLVLTCFASPQNAARLLPGTLLQADQDRLFPNLAFFLPRADRQRRRRVRCSEGGYYHYYAFVAAARDSNHGRWKWEIDRNRCSVTIPRRVGVLKISPVPNGESKNRDAVVAEESVDENKKSNRSTAFQDELQQLQQRHTLVFELQNNGDQTDKDFAVYGKLHRLLGRRRGLLGGANAVAIMTTLNFLVVHYGHDDSSSITGGSSSRLALGDPRWDVCGIDIDHGNTAMQGSGTDAVARGGSKEQQLLDTIARDLERTIEDVVKVVSRTELFPAELKPADTRRRQKQGEDLPRHTLRRILGRVRATTALALTPANSAPGVASHNPLLLVGVGALLSRKDCEIMAREAEGKDGWVPWDGDLGASSTAVSLESLPRSRELWEGAGGDAVRARIAGIYGVHESSVVSEAGDVFVCKITPDARGRLFKASFDQRREEEDEGIDGSRLAVSADFRRSKSLVTFSVALSTGLPPWVVCLEQRGQCLRPTGQGEGVVFSGKLRHALVTMLSEARAGPSGGAGEDAQDRPVVLRGFASIRDPRVREDSRRWEWGAPAWHVDAPYVKDEDILDRVWVDDGSADLGVATNPPVTALAGQASGGSRTVGVTASSPQIRLERMNTSAAHRYYRQGLEGMNIPVVGKLGRPVIDLVEDRTSRLPKSSSSGKASEVTIEAVLRRRFPWGWRRQVGKAGLSTAAGSSPRMDAALGELFGSRLPDGERLERVPVPPIKYVFVDPRYRGLGLGRRLFLEAMCSLARRGFRFALIVVEDNGSGGLFGFYEEMGFVSADELLGIPRAMIAPIPPPQRILAARD